MRLIPNIKYPRGSEWRKWDLHIHTPLSINQEYGGDKEEVWDEFISALENLPREVKVIGITDYYFIDGYEKVMKYKRNGRLRNIEKIFPILEFRIDTFGSSNENKLTKINLHILFNVDEEDLDNEIKTIREEFIDQIHLTKLEEHKTLKLSKQNFIKVAGDLKSGFSNYIPSTDEVFKLIFSKKWKDKVFLFLGYKEWSNLDKNNQLKPFKKDLYEKVNAFLTSNYSTYEKSQNWLLELGDKKLLHSLDIHNFSLLKDNYFCYTWIKADPTFEGLKQIIYEPEERVRIQESNPAYDFNKNYFSKIVINEGKIFSDSYVKFKEQEIFLNMNLVAIIGGRGTGKSLLLDAIAKTFNQTQNNDRAGAISIPSDDFAVEYTKSDKSTTLYKIQEDNNIDYLHIHQGFMKTIVDPKDPEKLSKEIIKLLNLSESPDFPFNKQEISKLIDEIFEIYDFLNAEDENGNLINSSEYIEEQIKRKKDLLETITTEKNRELISKYTENVNRISDAKTLKQTLENFKSELEEFENKKNTFIRNLNNELENKNNLIPEINFKEQILILNEHIDYYNNKISNLEKVNEEISNQFLNEGINEDISSLLEKAEIYQQEINNLQAQLQKIQQKNNKLEKKIEDLTSIIIQISESYDNYEKKIYEKWQTIKKGKETWNEEQKQLISELLEDIEIKVEQIFEIDRFFDSIRDFLNLQKFRDTKTQKRIERIKEWFEINNFNDFKNKFSNKEYLIELLEEEEVFTNYGKKEFFKFVFTKFENFWKTIIKPRYKNKEIEKLSVGMKGTMYLSLKLATNPFMNPFIFDQPEDDLDNEFIMNELVPIFKKIKKYRQVIIVTHNANLVVNTDAEQVIIAENRNEIISYTSGSIENPYIRNKICEILEGGKAAFEKREQKYFLK